MKVTGFYADSKWAWASNKAESATDDFEFPAANVYATSSLTALLETNNSWVFTGIVEYRKKNPKTGKHTTVKVGNLNLSLDSVRDASLKGETTSWRRSFSGCPRRRSSPPWLRRG